MVKVHTYKGYRQLENGVRRMQRRGWYVIERRSIPATTTFRVVPGRSHHTVVYARHNHLGES